MLIRLCSAALVAAFVLAHGPAHAAAIMTLNNRVTKDLTHADCMKRARSAISRAGLQYYDTTDEAVWGMANGRRDMVAVYCLTTADVVVFAAASPTGQGKVTEPLVNRVIDAWEALSR